MKINILILFIIIIFMSCLNLVAKPAVEKANVFAPGSISTNLHEDGSPWFNKDGNEVYWRVFDGKEFFINYKKKEGKKWSKIVSLQFFKKTRFGRICISPDGNKLFFSSDHPIKKGIVKKDFDFWYREKNGNKWGKPKHLGDVINSEYDELDLSVSSDGTIFFNREGKTKDAFLIFYSKYSNGKYLKPQKIGEPINSNYLEIAPFIAPDQSYIIFTSAGRPDGKGALDLYISFKNKTGGWTKPKNMGEKINSKFSEKFASISPDGKYLFFVSNRPRKMAKNFNMKLYSKQNIKKIKDFYNTENEKPYFCDIYYISLNIIKELKQ